MAIGPGEAILSTIGAQSAAWQQAEAEKHQNTRDSQLRLDEVARKLGEFPTLLRKGQEEREMKQIQEAATAGFLEKGWDGMLEASLAVPSTTPGAEALKFKIPMDVTEAKDRAETLALRSEELSLTKRENAARLAKEQYDLDFAKGRAKAVADAQVPTLQTWMTSGVGASPTPREQLSRIAASGFGTGEDVQKMAEIDAEQQELLSKARLAMDKDATILEKQAMIEATKKEKDALNFKVAMMNAGSKRLGVMLTGQGQAADLAVAMMRNANEKAMAQEKSKVAMKIAQLNADVAMKKLTAENAKGHLNNLVDSAARVLDYKQKELQLLSEGRLNYEDEDDGEDRIKGLSRDIDELTALLNETQNNIEKASKKEFTAPNIGILGEDGKSTLTDEAAGKMSEAELLKLYMGSE